MNSQLVILASFVVSAGIFACARQKDTAIPAHPVAEAYALMDQGENAKAILLLEREIQQDPTQSESRILLASAYLGEAGINVYGLHSSFQDILFSRPMAESFQKEEQGAQQRLIGKSEVPTQDASPKRSPLELLIDDLDRFLNILRERVEFLTRFPDIPPAKWPLLDESLFLLDPAGVGKDISLYRIFVRLIYLKAFISHRVIQDQSLGTRVWLCRLDFYRFKEDLHWLLKNLTLAIEDFGRAYPQRATGLGEIESWVRVILEKLEQQDQQHHKQDGKMLSALPETEFILFQDRLRQKLHCSEQSSKGNEE